MSNRNRPRGIAGNVLSNWGTFLFVAAVSFLLSPFVVRHLGDTAYGIWVLLGSLVGYLGLLDFGIRGAVTRYVAHHHAASDSDGSSSIVSAALVMFGLLGLVAIVVAGIFALLSPAIFNIPASLVDDTRLVLVLGGLSIAATLVGSVFGGVVTGLERFDATNSIEILVAGGRAIAVVVALQAGHGLVALALIQLAASALTGIAAWAVARRLYPELRLRRRSALLPHVRTIVSFSVLVSALQVLGALIYYSSALIIAVFLPVSAVTYYAIAGSLCEYARQMTSAISMVMTPRVSAMASIGGQRVGEEILGAARLASLVTAPIAATFWLRGESFISLWMGPEYGPASGQVLRVLALMVLLVGARSVVTASLIGMNKHRMLVPAFAFEAACNLSLSVALVGALGIVGVALGSLIPSVLVSLAYIPRCFSMTTGIAKARFYRKAWLLPVVACIPFALTQVALERYLPAQNLAVFFAQIAFTLPLFLACAMVLCLTPQERASVTSALVNAGATAARGLRRK